MKSEKSKLIKPWDEVHGGSYVVVEELPLDQRAPFSEWLIGQTLPVVLNEEQKYGRTVVCAYSWDYSIWYDYWVKDEVAPLED